MQADITAAAINQQDRRHILSCLPTGMGKTLPMLLKASEDRELQKEEEAMDGMPTSPFIHKDSISL